MVEKRPAVSICCNTYNHELYIEQTIEGFISQKTNFDFEILIHDDASTDSTSEIIKKYTKAYPDKIKPIYQTENKFKDGYKMLYEFQIKRANGKYIAICEGDDYWTDYKKLQKQYDMMEGDPECSLCFHAAKLVNYDNRELQKFQKPYNNNCYVNIESIISQGGGFIPTASILCRKEVFDNLPQFYFDSPVGDYPLQLIAAAKGDIYYLNDVMSVYRKNTPSSWSRKMLLGKNLKKRKREYVIKTIDVLKSFDEYTNREYNYIVKNKITSVELSYLVLTNKHFKLFKNPYRAHMKKMGLYRKSRFLLSNTFPKLLTIIMITLRKI